MTMISDRPGADTALGGRLTPETVRRLDFPRRPLGRRGYHESDVERFRNRVVLEIVTSNAEKAELRQEIQRLRDYYRRQGIGQSGVIARQGGGQPGSSRRGSRLAASAEAAHASASSAASVSSVSSVSASSGPSSGRLSVDAVNVMSRAQQAADQHIAQAEEYARRLIATARSQYEEILVHAHSQAEQASEEASQLLGRQREIGLESQRAIESGTGSSGRSATGELPVDAASDPLDSDQAAHLLQLESRLTYMRTFAQVTRVQLRSILDALGEELDHLSVSVPEPDGATR